MQSNHTPGSWQTDGLDIHGKTVVAFCATADKKISEAQANAKLIAAAPEMLELLIRCKDYLHTKYPKEADIFNQINFVIQKATE